MQEINEKINNVRGAVTMAYPMGLPEWDLAKIALDEPIDNLMVGYNLQGSLYLILDTTDIYIQFPFRTPI